MSEINYQNNEKKNVWQIIKDLCKNSFFISLLVRFSDFLYGLVKKSLFFGFFASYKKTEKLYKNSFFGKFAVGNESFGKHLKNIKNRFASLCENSRVLNFCIFKTKRLLFRPLKNYGAFLFCFSLYSLAIHLIKRFYLDSVPLIHSDLAFSIILLAASVVLLPSKKPLIEALGNSRIISALFGGIFDFEKKPDEKDAPVSNSPFIVVGMLLGALSYFISPLVIIAAVAALIAVVVVFNSPEVGVVFLFPLLPFLPTMLLASLIGLTFCSYLYKLARGKRNMKTEIIDVLVILFALVLLCGGLFSVDTSTSLPPALMFVCFLLSYILISNLLRSMRLVKKCAALSALSLFFVSAYGIYQYFFGTMNGSWIDEEMFSDIGNRVVSTFENPNVLGEYLVMAIPIALGVAAICTTFRSKVLSLGCAFCALICLVFTWSRGAWIGLILGVAVYLLMMNKKTMILIALGICSIPALPFVLPSSIINRFTSIGNIADSSTNYRLYIWKAVTKMLGDHAIAGIGIGEGAFSKIYPAYTYAGIESAPHSHNLYMQLCAELGVFGILTYLAIIVIFIQYCVSFIADKNYTDPSMRAVCIGGLSGLFAVLVQGLTDYTWYNYRVYLIFWMILALCVSAKRSSDAQYLIRDDDRTFLFEE